MDELMLTHDSLAFPAIAAGPADGDLVLLLHGFPQTAQAWSGQVEALGAVGWRAVAPDLRGFAAGALPETVDRYTQECIRADVFAMADQLGADQFHLVGHDLGGIVAWDLACRYPDRIRTLAVASTPHLAAFAAALRPVPPARDRRTVDAGRQRGRTARLLQRPRPGSHRPLRHPLQLTWIPDRGAKPLPRLQLRRLGDTAGRPDTDVVRLGLG